MSGCIFVVSDDARRCSLLSLWILEWIDSTDLALERTVYFCDSIDLARESLAAPLREGDPPALVVIDRAISRGEDFAGRVADCIPETWVVELVDEHDTLPSRPGLLALRRSARREEWDGLLHHVFFESPTPQWSRTGENAG